MTTVTNTSQNTSQLVLPTCPPSFCPLPTQIFETKLSSHILSNTQIEHILVEHNVNNRIPSKINIKKIKDSIERNGWVQTGECLKFTTNRSLVNGQHVLRALLELNHAPVEHCFISDLPENVDELMSPPKQRLLKDVIQKYDPSVNLYEVGVLRSVHMLLRPNNNSKLSNQDVMYFWDMYGVDIRKGLRRVNEMLYNSQTRSAARYYRGFKAWRALCEHHDLGEARTISNMVSKPDGSLFSNQLNKILDLLPISVGVSGVYSPEPYTDAKSFEAILIRILAIAIDRVIDGKDSLYDVEHTFNEAICTRKATLEMSTTYTRFTQERTPLMDRAFVW